MEMRQDNYREHWNRRRRQESEDPSTSNIHLHWEGRAGSRPSRRSRTVTYVFVLGGIVLAAFLVLALVMLYSTGAAVPR